jgi:hypothetical protein
VSERKLFEKTKPIEAKFKRNDRILRRIEQKSEFHQFGKLKTGFGIPISVNSALKAGKKGKKVRSIYQSTK